MATDLVWGWRTISDPWAPQGRIPSPLADRFGEPVRIICRGANGNLLLEFEDGFRTVAPRWAARKAREGRSETRSAPARSSDEGNPVSRSRRRRTPGTSLVRPIRSTAWECRTAWAKGWRISLSIDGDVRRVEGFVSTVSATDAFVVVRGVHVPLDRVLAVHRPSRLADSTFEEDGRERWRGPVPRAIRDRDPRQLGFDIR